MKNRRFILESQPVGKPTSDGVVWREEELPPVADGQILIRNLLISLDPAIRGWMDDAPSYLPPIPLGEPVRATTIGRVVESRNPEFSEGDLVLGLNGWDDYSLSTGYVGPNKIGVIEDTFGLSLEYFLSVLGPTGLTAYFGVEDVLKPKQGETLVVSAAGGAVGSVVGQIAHLRGANVIGLAGSDEKCRRIEEEFGFQHSINYRSADDLLSAVRDLAPEGVEMYFDNVGGPILDAMLLAMEDFGRIAMCGMISQYNLSEPPAGPRNLWQVVVRSLEIRGFLVRDYAERFPEALQHLSQWLNDGLIHHTDHVVDGLENTLEAFHMLFDGSNQGKLSVRIADDV